MGRGFAALAAPSAQTKSEYPPPKPNPSTPTPWSMVYREWHGSGKETRNVFSISQKLLFDHVDEGSPWDFTRKIKFVIRYDEALKLFPYYVVTSSIYLLLKRFPNFTSNFSLLKHLIKFAFSIDCRKWERTHCYILTKQTFWDLSPN